MAEDRNMLRLFTLDPLHIGVGQDIMGEVDLPIDRESETGLPRIPGTALKGGFRAHAAWKLKMDGKKDKSCPGDQPEDGKSAKQRTRAEYCAIESCPICQTFGFPSLNIQQKQIAGHEGRVWFRDARLAFFPALTDKGTLWFSTPGRAAAWLEVEGCEYPELLGSGTGPLALSVGRARAISTLRVGWLAISGIADHNGNEQVQQVVEALQKSTLEFPTEKYWQHIVNNAVLLDENNFYRLVETCLERRTCNRVDQETGTVAQGALFSYEALPRASLLCSRIFAEKAFSGTVDYGYTSPVEVCKLSGEGFARMGIGGMQTRGLGSLLVELSSREAGNG
uniref:type III-B CRISPR module RAMP protein Cmr4 n=1 Tax=Candidatus Electrothrix sp. TaxID=2170559 RepID=UPI0040567442